MSRMTDVELLYRFSDSLAGDTTVAGLRAIEAEARKRMKEECAAVVEEHEGAQGGYECVAAIRALP